MNRLNKLPGQSPPLGRCSKNHNDASAMQSNVIDWLYWKNRWQMLGICCDCTTALEQSRELAAQRGPLASACVLLINHRIVRSALAKPAGDPGPINTFAFQASVQTASRLAFFLYPRGCRAIGPWWRPKQNCLLPGVLQHAVGRNLWICVARTRSGMICVVESHSCIALERTDASWKVPCARCAFPIEVLVLRSGRDYWTGCDRRLIEVITTTNQLKAMPLPCAPAAVANANAHAPPGAWIPVGGDLGIRPIYFVAKTFWSAEIIETPVIVQGK
jgi:hypothetical protein